MKQYNYAPKKIKSKSNVESLPKKKKSKTLEDVKHLKKEIKKLIEDTPIFLKGRKKEEKQQRPGRNHSTSLNSKHLKPYSRSEELFSLPKTKKKKAKAESKEDLQEISFSMPMTSKIIRLFSNNSAIYNSHKELEFIDKGKQFVIPT